MEHLTKNERKVSCPVCFEDFDEFSHVPYSSLFKGCGHSVCIICLHHLVKTCVSCPVCRASWNSSNDGKWGLNMKLFDLLPSFYGNQQLNEELRKLNMKYEQENDLLLKKYKELTGETIEKVLFTGELKERPKSSSSQIEVQKKENWIINWQYHEATDIVNDLVHDNYILDEVNAHLRRENSKLEWECTNLEEDKKVWFGSIRALAFSLFSKNWSKDSPLGS